MDFAALKMLYNFSDFRKTSVLLWIGHTRLILCAAYQCMELQSAISQVRKVTQQDMYAFCLMTWRLAYPFSSVEYVTSFIKNCHCIEMIEMLTLFIRLEFFFSVCGRCFPSNWKKWAQCSPNRCPTIHS